MTGLFSNPAAKQTPENVLHKHQNHVDDTIMALNMHSALRNGLGGSSEDASFHEESLQDDQEEEEEGMRHAHPAGEASVSSGREGVFPLA